MNVVLVGMMGSGKSTVGANLARRLGKTLVDTDALVEEAAGRSVGEIWEREGEEAFREMEAKAVREATSQDGIVIACGGGVVIDPDLVREIRRSGMVFYLRANPETLAARIGSGTGELQRPLLGDGDTRPLLEEILSERTGLYEDAAHVIVDVDGLGVDEVATAIIGELS